MACGLFMKGGTFDDGSLQEVQDDSPQHTSAFAYGCIRFWDAFPYWLTYNEQNIKILTHGNIKCGIQLEDTKTEFGINN